MSSIGAGLDMILTAALAAFFGLLVGLALGLIGGGGATLAVPLLVFGLSVDPPHAAAISLLSVGGAAVAGFWQRARRHEVDLGAGAMLAGGGVLGAPVGAWMGVRISDVLFLGLFGALVLIVSARMWQRARRPTDVPTGPCAVSGRISWRCISALSASGLMTGLFSGLFGIGGGFVIVPAVVFATGCGMHRAVATSLMVISIVSAVALAAMLATGREISWMIAVPFLAGSLTGMAAGTALGRGLPGPRLQQTFAVALGLVGALVVVRSLTL